jgi:iron(II)-dependent oxidoreductase
VHGRAEFAAADSGARARQAAAAELADALQASRHDTLATFAAYERALGSALKVPCRPGLNPPLWELGHIGWFQAHWLMRNPQRTCGHVADPDAVRLPYGRAGADRWYDSSRVPHAGRWSLTLPDADATRADLALQLADAVRLLHDTDDSDRSLYFHRLVLFHEDMHHEAALYMARSLGIAIDDPRWQAPAAVGAREDLHFDASRWSLGRTAPGFVFDNESPPHEQAVPGCSIDSQVLTWADYLPFVESGGYREGRWWTDTGCEWLRNTQAAAPLYVRRDGRHWMQLSARGVRPLPLSQPAEHLSAHEAQAWCRWAGRRLPTEAEWERAACARPSDFIWGHVWEWTASDFAPFPGFSAHPYRDYSQPWFDGRPVLRGASYLTQPRMRHVHYRNFFTAGRNDICAGFRTCARAPG